LEQASGYSLNSSIPSKFNLNKSPPSLVAYKASIDITRIYINITFIVLLDNQLIKMYKSRLLVAMILLLSINLLGQEDYGFLPPISVTAGAELRSSMCVRNPSRDRPWDRSKSFETQVNEAITAENRTFGTSYRAYNHPTYDPNDALDISAKVIAELRSVYNMPEVDIEYDQSLMDLATNHSCAMDVDNTFCHTCPSDGSFNSRVNDRIGSRCFQSISENIAWITIPELEPSILRVLYLMMYADVACCDNGHRDNFLNCNFNENSKIGFGIIRGDLQASNGAFLDAWIMTWDYLTFWSYPDCGDCNCGVTIGTPLCDASAGAVLPIDLYSFETYQTSCNEVSVTWSTNSESNNDNFTLERSNDGLTWFAIQMIDGAGNSKVLSTYSVTDKLTNASSTFFYRLIQTDFDGNSIISEVISVENDCSDNEISIYPNPARSYVQINSKQRVSKISVYSLTGKLIVEQDSDHIDRLDIGSLRSGVYLVAVEKANGDKQVKRLVKE